jgi:3-oxoacyl-[acyl-carrier-protein] synthase II
VNSFLLIDLIDFLTEKINYINAHATSTPAGDIAEIIAIKRLFNQVDLNQIENEIYISSLKGSLGHLLGAAGAVETIFTILSCKEKTMGPSINIETLDSNLKLDEVPFLKILQKTKTLNNSNNKNKFVALKNSFGFGGTNVSICIGNYSK